MISKPLAACLLAAIVAQPALAQQTLTPPAGLQKPDACGRLADFLRQNPGADPSMIRVTLDEVERYRSQKNVYACRQAISDMQVTGIELPEPLLEAIGR
jgi:hypothetical protein